MRWRCWQVSEYKGYLLKRFSWVSRIYDIFCAPTSILRRAPLEFCYVKKETRILEVGTGTGNLSLDLSLYSDHVFAGDISPDMLGRAVRKNKEKKVKYLLFDGTKLPFPDKSFDFSLTAAVLHEIPEEIIENMLLEMKRVTKEKVIVIDYAMPRNTLSGAAAKLVVSVYESRYFGQFMKIGLPELFGRCGLKLEREKRLLGIFKIWVLNADNQ